MSTGCGPLARVLLKARPTREQLDDRLQAPAPEGLEFYLDGRDISAPDWLSALLALLETCSFPPEFNYVVEGPLGSLDGQFFNVARDSDADREVVDRLVEFGKEVRAKAAVIHCIAPGYEPFIHDRESRRVIRERALPFIDRYAGMCLKQGMVPTIENIPPVAQMRQSAFMFSGLGMEPGDLLYFTDRVEGLRITFDVSHARLYLNAVNARPGEAGGDLAKLVQYLAGNREVTSLEEYVKLLGNKLYEVHVSNAARLFDEGLPYDQGDMDLDLVMADLLPKAEFIVTETIEPDPNRATYMREAQERILAVRARLQEQGGGWRVEGGGTVFSPVLPEKNGKGLG
ncbi:MAG: hypothetical protein Q7O66_03445 [Dehalococcoidia bacterium]|nr:hypothetical protein [Dehalococcoidia bacterium]